ncbi:MAG: DUF1326 domain-containing protein [Deltaproteobacteria bacterium]|nr:DUF1326 domain-containing protein [Deltaproteobacteria bacterium]
MADQWMIRGVEYGNCNCAWGCPCQFNAPSTYGKCEAIQAALIEEGHFNDTPLDGLAFLLLLKWPGEIADGNGAEQVIITDKADAAQHEALRKIAHGESTAPGSNGFYVYNSTMTTVHDTLVSPMEVEIDVEARTARIVAPGLVESHGSPIINEVDGSEHRARIHLPDGFEYTYAEMGNASSTVTAAFELSFKDSYGQFNELHLNQDGVIR